jgi:hypothetical protein
MVTKQMQMQVKHTAPERLIRAAILNGAPLPAVAVAQLEARGVNVGDLENRLRQQLLNKWDL